MRVDGHTYPTPTHLNYTLFHPVGVCALISPWNVPFMTATWKVGACLAFGNTAVLKMSELSPLTAARLGELALEAGIRPACSTWCTATARKPGEPLVPTRRARHFVHRLHRHRQPHRAGRGPEKFSMELGGKSPFVIFDDADLDRALDAAVFMIFQQRRALHRRQPHPGAEVDLRRLRRRSSPSARSDHRGRPAGRETIVGPMISQAHLAKVKSYIELGPKEGADAVCGGSTAVVCAGAAARWAGATSSAHGVRRRRQPHEDRAGRNLRPGGLPDPVHDEGRRDPHRQRHPVRPVELRLEREHRPRAPRGAAAIEAGMCFVNSQNVRDLRQPFGGTKASGTGREGRHLELRGSWSQRTRVSLGSHHIPHWGV